MAEFKLTQESISNLVFDNKGTIVSIKTLTPELRKVSEQFLKVLFSFGRYSYVPCISINKPLEYPNFLNLYTLWFPDEYDYTQKGNHKHIDSFFSYESDEFFIGILTGKIKVKRLVVTVPEIKEQRYVLFASKKGDDSVEKSISTSVINLNDTDNDWNLSIGSSTLLFQKYNKETDKPFNIKTYVKDNKLCIEPIEFDNFELDFISAPRIMSIYKVLYDKKIFSDGWFCSCEFIEKVFKQYKQRISDESSKLEKMKKKLIEWQQKEIISKKIKKIIYEDINPLILKNPEKRYYVIRKIEEEGQGKYIIPQLWLHEVPPK